MWAVKLMVSGRPDLNVTVLCANANVKEQAKQVFAKYSATPTFAEVHICDIPEKALVDMFGAQVVSSAVQCFTEALASQMMTQLTLQTWSAGFLRPGAEA